MLYPAELQALPQARTGTLPQGESLCLGGVSRRGKACFREERIGEQKLFSLALQRSAEGRQLSSLFSCQPVFFFTKRRRKANDRDGGLDVAGAFDISVMVRGDAHRSTDQRPERIDRAGTVRCKGRAGQVLELLGQLFGEPVRPGIDHL